jgi:hypothetical protein
MRFIYNDKIYGSVFYTLESNRFEVALVINKEIYSFRKVIVETIISSVEIPPVELWL